MDENSFEDDPKVLMKLARDGDDKAFSRLYELYFTPVFRYIYFRVRDKMAAEDLTQTVFLKVYASIANFQERNKSPLAYFFTVARNTVIDYWRKENNNAIINSEDMISKIEDSKNGPKELLERKQTEETIRNAIQHLTEGQREVIILKFINGLSTKEVSNLLQKTEEAIRQIQCRALRRLRDYLKNFKSIL